MSYRFGIPSYKRGNCQHSLKLLSSLGYKRKDIVISTQTITDFEEYKKKYELQATIIYKAADNDSQNRNTVLDYMEEGERFLLIDDDIKYFSRLVEKDGKKTLRRITKKAELEKTFDWMFDYSMSHNSPIWAWYPVANAFFMKDSIDLRNIFVGTILGIANTKEIRFDERFDLKGDFEISLRLMQQGFNAVRFNGYTAEANHKSKGGCEYARKAGSNARRYAELLAEYPELIKPSNRDGEIKFIGKKKGV